MKIKCLIVIIFILVSNTLLAQSKLTKNQDSLSVEIDRSITRYLASVPLRPDSLINASDRLINAGGKNGLSSHIASRLYTIFRNIDIMGLESVAVYIAQNYFLNGKLNPPDSLNIIDLKLFVDFNKHSLIGMKAPNLRLNNIKGESVTLSNSLGYSYTILLFFDDNCTVCKVELPLIKNLSDSLNTEGVNVFAVYTQPDTSRLSEYIKNEFKSIPNNWIFATDPSYSSDFQRLYNVIKTPQIFLLDKSGKVAGRNLSYSSLNILIKKLKENEKELSEQAKRFAAAYMEAVNYEDTSSVRSSFADLHKRLTEIEDKELYRTMFSYIYEELLYSESELKKQASVIVGSNFILPFSSFWRDTEYPEVWVASMVRRSMENRVGKKFKVSTLVNTKGKKVKLGKSCSKYTLIYFTDPNCAACSLYTSKLKSEYSNLTKLGIKVTGVYPMGTIESSLHYKTENKLEWEILSPVNENFKAIFSNYEAETVPSSILINRRGKIVSKNIDFATIKDIIK